MNYSSVYKNDLVRVQSVIPNLESIKERCVLVTGSTGLVCSALVDFLFFLNDTSDAHVKILIAARSVEKVRNRFGNILDRPDVSFVEYDALKDLSWQFDVDYIIHGASPANPSLYVKQPVETMLANFIGINSILKYSSTHNVKRVLFVSSSEVYGRKDNALPYGDSEYGFVDILNPRACYPSAKRASETLCSAYLSEYGVESVIVRLGHIFGPTATRSDSRASSQFFFDVIDGRNILMKSAGSQLRSYVYVPDCVSAIFTVLLNGESGNAYNISNPDSIVTIRMIAQQIADCAGKEIVFENPTDEEKSGYNLMDNSSLDGSRLISLGWRGLFSLKDGVEHTLQSLK